MRFQVLFGEFLEWLVLKHETNRHTVVVLYWSNLLVWDERPEFVIRCKAERLSQRISEWKMMLVHSLLWIWHLLMFCWRRIIRIGRDWDLSFFVHAGRGVHLNLRPLLYLFFRTSRSTCWPYVFGFNRWEVEIFCRICKTHTGIFNGWRTRFGLIYVLIWKW